MSSDPISGIQHNSFITLTYDQVNLPDHASLEVEHWQLFAKRLRKNVGPFRYYHCGEYGEDTQRPHYHAVIWGQDFLRDRMLYKTSSGHKLYTSKTLDETWQKGKCYIGSVTYESAAYVARYCMKKLNGEKGREAYAVRDPGTGRQLVNTETGEMISRKPPYTTMSKGIGQSWLKKYKSDVYPNDHVITNGNQARPPRYYDNQLTEIELKSVKSKRTAKAKEHYKNNTHERLETRETCAKAKNNLRTREPSINSG